MSPEIFVTTHDAARLSRVLEAFRDPSYAPLTAFLASALQRATVVAPCAVPYDVVTMNARVRFQLDTMEEPREATLVWPGRGDSLLGRLSVLTPAGSALIGMREGETNTWRGLDGRQRRVTILKVLYQPEAQGLDLGGAEPDAVKSGCLSG
jgi:regulator of nucleoside diphosphate kinase